MMKYQKANAEIVSFDHNEIFMIQSGDTITAISAAMAKWGLSELRCEQGVTYSGGTLSCEHVWIKKGDNAGHYNTVTLYWYV